MTFSQDWHFRILSKFYSKVNPGNTCKFAIFVKILNPLGSPLIPLKYLQIFPKMHIFINISLDVDDEA